MPRGQLAAIPPACGRHRLPEAAPGLRQREVLVAVLWPNADALGFVPTLARLSRLVRDPDVASTITQARSPTALCSVIAEVETGSNDNRDLGRKAIRSEAKQFHASCTVRHPPRCCRRSGSGSALIKRCGGDQN